MVTKIKSVPSRWLRPSLTGVFVVTLLPMVLLLSLMFDQAHFGNRAVSVKANIGSLGAGIEREVSPMTTGIEMMPTEVGSQDMMRASDALWAPTPAAISPTLAPDRSIATTASIEARVESVDWSVGKIREIVVAQGGYVQGASVNRPTYGEKSAWMTVKVPAADFLSTFDEIKKAFTQVTGENINASDITAAVYDTQARLKNKRVEETTLQELLGSTSDVASVLKITDRLAQVRSEIESLEASERTLNEQVAMASVSINLTEDPKITSDTNNLRSGNVFKVAVNELLRGLTQIGSGLVIVVVAGLPIALIYFICLWIIYFFTKKGVKKLFDR